MQYKTGDILKGKINGREFKIINAENNFYMYEDLKTKKKFIVDCKTLEQCAVEKIG